MEDFPAFIVVDDKGNDFFQDPAPQPTFTSIPVRGPGSPDPDARPPGR